ncbi:hypothetical protein PTT_19544, partial [Pyrenophora teres f. teres 0-1]
LVTRWLALLNLWDFDIVHVPGKKNVVADALSRRPEPEGWEPPEEPEEDVEDFIDAHLNATQLILEEIYETTPALLYGCCPADLSFSAKPLDDSYSEESQQLAAWILFRKRPENLNRSELRKFKHKALRMTVRERHLFTLPSGGRPLRRVVDDPEQQREIIRELHDNSGHRGKEATVQEALWPTEPPSILFGWITIDVVHMPPGLNGRKYLIVARDYASGWPEAKALAKNDSKAVQKFLINDVFSRWGLPLKISNGASTELFRVLIIRKGKA